MWCRLKNEKGNYEHNLYGYLFDLSLWALLVEFAPLISNKLMPR